MTLLAVHDLEMRFGTKLIQRHVSFTVEPGTIFAIIGGSGCGKSTLLRHLVGLLRPAAGRVEYEGVDYWASDQDTRERLRRRLGMLFQSAALWSGMTLLENVSLPLELHTELDAPARRAKAQEVLAWVGLEKFGKYYPADLSGGMKKRAGLARAIVAEPPLLMLDEPTSGLDPISSKRLDDLILEVRERTGAAVLVVSHELPSLLAIADDGIFLDADSKAADRARQPARVARDRGAPGRARLPAPRGARRIPNARRGRLNMKRQALLLGSFVLGALALVVAAIVWLSGANPFETQLRAVIYFQGSVSGLYVGAPVTFRGVPVGQVDGIGIEVDSRTLDARIPVRIRLRPDVVQFNGEPDTADIPTLVKRGLRARLAAQSFVTGQKFIDLDFLPDSPARFTRDGKQAEAEIPPMSDRFGALIDQVADLPLADTVQELRATLKELQVTLKNTQSTLDLAEKEIADTAVEARKTLAVANTSLQQVQGSASATMASVRRLTDTTRETVEAAQPELQRTLRARARRPTRRAGPPMRRASRWSASATSARRERRCVPTSTPRCATSPRRHAGCATGPSCSRNNRTP